MRYRAKKVLVTGAGGFIGSHLCEALVGAGAEVTAMIHYSSRSDWGNLEFLPPDVRAQLNVVAGNSEDRHFATHQVSGQDVVFHLAALITIPFSYIASLSYVRTNVEGTLNVLEAARQVGVGRAVHTSTSETYCTAVYSPVDEKHALQGQSPYSESKIGADKIVESYHGSLDLPVATLRPFNTYGPRQSARSRPSAISVLSRPSPPPILPSPMGRSARPSTSAPARASQSAILRGSSSSASMAVPTIGWSNAVTRQTPWEDPRARRAMTEKGFYVICAPGGEVLQGSSRQAALQSAVSQRKPAKGCDAEPGHRNGGGRRGG